MALIYQCDFTVRRGGKLFSNPDFNLQLMLEAAEVMAARVRQSSPESVVVFTIPVLPKIRSASQQVRRDKAMVAKGQRDLKALLRARGFRAFDLALNYECSEGRTTTCRRYLPDEVHPSARGIEQMFRDLGRVVIGWGLLPGIARRRGMSLEQWVREST